MSTSYHPLHDKVGDDNDAPSTTVPTVVHNLPVSEASSNNGDESVPLIDDQHQRARSSSVYLYIVLYIVFNVITSVNRKLMYDAYGHRYQFFRLQLTNFLYDVYATFIVVYRVFWTGQITRRMRSYPLYKFAGIAFLDGAADFLTSVAGINTPGDWQVLINQLVIPITMALAAVILAQRYTKLEISGAGVIIVGLVIALMPLFTGHAQSKSSGSPSVRWYAIIIFVCAMIPRSASGVYKEVVFKEAFLDIFWVTAIVSWTQLVLTWCFLPLQSLKSFGGVSLSSLPEVYRGGFNCFLGDRSTPVYDNNNHITGYCSPDVPRFTMMFSVSGFCSGIFQLLVLKHGSAVLSVMATAIALPLSNIAFSIHFIMGDQVENFSYYDLGGLVLVCAGFILYRWKELQTAFDNKQTAKEVVYDEEITSP